MDKVKLLPEELLQGFNYPAPFMRMVNLGIYDLEPWYLLEGEFLITVYNDLRKLYPTRRLIPFYRRQDKDDLVCWDVNLSNTKVFRIHIGASPGWEERGSYNSVYDWLKTAIEDFIEFDTENYEWSS